MLPERQITVFPNILDYFVEGDRRMGNLSGIICDVFMSEMNGGFTRVISVPTFAMRFLILLLFVSICYCEIVVF